MTIPPRTEEINIVRINFFTISSTHKNITIHFDYAYKDLAGDVLAINSDVITLDTAKYTQLLNSTPPGNKKFNEWIRPLIYAQIADHLGIPVGDID